MTEELKQAAQTQRPQNCGTGYCSCIEYLIEEQPLYPHPAPGVPEDIARDAARYRYLRDRTPKDVLGNTGQAAGCWIDCEDEDGSLTLLTGDDADTHIDAAAHAKGADK